MVLVRATRLFPVIIGSLCSVHASAQWDRFDSSRPRAAECRASALMQIGMWDRAAPWWRRHVRQHADCAFGWYFLTLCLAHAGEFESALAAGERALDFPGVRAHTHVVIARVQAQQGASEAALASLQAARDAQYVSVEPIGSADAFATLQRAAEFRRIAATFSSVRERFESLADADDHTALVALWRANNHTWFGAGKTTNLVLQECVEAHMKAVGSKSARKRAEQLALRAMRGAKAADEAIGSDALSTYVAAMLALDADGRRAYDTNWKRIRKASGIIRSHRFAPAIELADEVLEAAKSLGDVIALRDGHYIAGLARIALVDHGQQRRGVAKQDEWKDGAAHFGQVERLALAIGDVKNTIQGVDFQATARISMGEGEHVVPELWRGIVLSNRVEASARELGMWERMWREAIGD